MFRCAEGGQCSGTVERATTISRRGAGTAGRPDPEKQQSKPMTWARASKEKKNGEDFKAKRKKDDSRSE